MSNAIHICHWVSREIDLPTTFIFFFLAEFSLKLLDREFFLCLVHPFLPFRLVALGLL